LILFPTAAVNHHERDYRTMTSGGRTTTTGGGGATMTSE
jgi:hypothetical protein